MNGWSSILRNIYDTMNLIEKAIEKINAKSDYFDALPGVVIIHHIQSTTVIYMSKRGLKNLDTTVEELQTMGTEYHQRFFNPEDAVDYVPKIFGLLERNNDEEIVTFFQQVRRNEEHPWCWYASSTKIFMRDENFLPAFIITIAIPIDAKHYLTNKIERLLEENNLLRSSLPAFNSLTKREKEIVTMMAKNKPSIEICKELHIAEDTVKTHRRNIKRKLQADTQYDIVKFAQAFDLV